MKPHEIVNRIVKKFGGNRVRFELIGDDVVWVVIGGNEYRCIWQELNRCFVVKRSVNESWETDNYSRWVEGILNNMVRNEAGEMVPR